MEVIKMKKVVGVVTFPDTDKWSNTYNKEYNFVTDQKDLETGDTVVVDTVNGLRIATFQHYDNLGFGETGRKTPTKWIVQKVDLEAHCARIEAAEKATKLKQLMDKKRKEAQEMEIYEILAEKNPELKEMLEEYKKLQEVL
jgi:hypothetical protein